MWIVMKTFTCWGGWKLIFDIYGRKQKIIFNSQFSILNSIDISHLPASSYILRVSTDNGVVMRKVVKE